MHVTDKMLVAGLDAFWKYYGSNLSQVARPIEAAFKAMLDAAEVAPFTLKEHDAGLLPDFPPGSPVEWWQNSIRYHLQEAFENYQDQVHSAKLPGGLAPTFQVKYRENSWRDIDFHEFLKIDRAGKRPTRILYTIQTLSTINDSTPR